MRKHSTESVASSSPTWRLSPGRALQQLLQRMLEEEVDGVLGRGRDKRRNAVDADAGCRNGSGKPWQLSLSSGTITLQRPRVRGLEERLESRLLPAFKRRTDEVGRLLPELWRLAQGDFDLALRRLRGEGARTKHVRHGATLPHAA